MRDRRALMLSIAGLIVALVVWTAGCGSTSGLLAYTGGGLPPGDGDIGGIVLAALPSATAAAAVAGSGAAAMLSAAPAATSPVVGAEVTLLRGTSVVGRTQTGPQGYFRFVRPAGGRYVVAVEPPAGSGLQAAQRQFQHRYGQRTFLEIVLEPAAP